MRAAYALIGLGFVIIFGGLYLFASHVVPSDDTNENFTIPGSHKDIQQSMRSNLLLTSSEFAANTPIPSKYTCDDTSPANPPLTISGVPAEAESLALIMYDPDVPKALKPDGVFDHWVLFNIPPSTRDIATGMTVGTVGASGAGKNQYIGPCPPTQYEPSEHRYFFKLYALDTELPLSVGATKADVEKAMGGHVIAETQLVGKYKRR